jgi:hypothetical protein
MTRHGAPSQPPALNNLAMRMKSNKDLDLEGLMVIGIDFGTT